MRLIVYASQTESPKPMRPVKTRPGLEPAVVLIRRQFQNHKHLSIIVDTESETDPFFGV